MAKLKVQHHKPVHQTYIDKALIRYTDDLVLAILNANWTRGLTGPTPHMNQAIDTYSDYRKELLG